MANQDNPTDSSPKKKEITYFVNGEKEKTDRPKLTVRAILEGAGFIPVTDFTLKSKDPKLNFKDHYDEEVEIHEDQRFHALFKGVTPTS
jgi:hypothetical protein